MVAHRIRTLIAGVTLVALLASSGVTPHAAAAQPDNIVLRWNDAALQGVRESNLGPPMVARALAIVHTCMYDAWAAYDPVAVGTQLGSSIRRPSSERRFPDQVEAMSYAAHRAAVDLFPASRATVFDPLLRELGLDPGNRTTDLRRPAGVGNVACDAVLAFRHHDGANQLGDEPGTPPAQAGVPYADYAGFVPANQPMDLTAPFVPGTVLDPARWQPLRYRDSTGQPVSPLFIAPYWTDVDGFALDRGDALRPSNPLPAPDSEAYRAQALEVLRISASLTDEQKVIAEYWADGPRSELPPGHWGLFAQFVSRRDHHGPGRAGVERDVKLFFALTNAVFDASIAAWDAKAHFDGVRPITAIRWLFADELVQAWGGPGQGTRTMLGSEWLPYQPSTFPTPPFAEYVSGHSAFSAAGAEILRQFTGSDRFGASATFPIGSSRVEPGMAPAHPVTLRWETFSRAADEAGVSRLFGGIHFTRGDLDGRTIGRACAERAWVLANRYFDGTVA